KRNRADGSVGSPHVRVGHRQAPNILDKRAESQLNKLAFLHFAFLTATSTVIFTLVQDLASLLICFDRSTSVCCNSRVKRLQCRFCRGRTSPCLFHIR
ncbi:hypothetical protein ACE02H_21500, partial [Shewanella mangrovisoli]|uniref:hypothetical protein n=1 Tax=Shewanella mangrovisoli TaxID=2864211 RepID=UPI0035B7DAAC